MLCHMSGRRPEYAHAADRVFCFNEVLRLVDKAVMTSLCTEMIVVTIVIMHRLVRRRVDRHPANRIAGDGFSRCCHGLFQSKH